MADTSKRVFEIPEFCEAFGIGRTLAYEEIKVGRLRTFVVGKRGRRISLEAAEAWLREREAACAPKEQPKARVIAIRRR